MNKKKKLKKKENKFKGIHDNNTAITVMKHLCVAIIFDKYFYINLYITFLPLLSRLRNFKILKCFTESFENFKIS